MFSFFGFLLSSKTFQTHCFTRFTAATVDDLSRVLEFSVDLLPGPGPNHYYTSGVTQYNGHLPRHGSQNNRIWLNHLARAYFQRNTAHNQCQRCSVHDAGFLLLFLCRLKTNELRNIRLELVFELPDLYLVRNINYNISNDTAVCLPKFQHVEFNKTTHRIRKKLLRIYYFIIRQINLLAHTGP